MSAESTDAAVRVPLAVLDLVPIAAGATAGEALRNSIDLAQRAEAFGYERYWLAEHHLNPGVAGSAPHTLLGIIAGATERIRVGSEVTVCPDRIDERCGPGNFAQHFAIDCSACCSGSSGYTCYAFRKAEELTPRLVYRRGITAI